MSIQGHNIYTFSSVLVPGFVIDLSKADDRTISLRAASGGSHQQWIAHGNPEGNWSFRNLYNNSYLGIEGSATEGALFVAVKAPFYFRFNHDPSDPADLIKCVFLTNFLPGEDAERRLSLISATNWRFVLQVVGGGIAESGTKLELGPIVSGDFRDSQLWKATSVLFALGVTD